MPRPYLVGGQRTDIYWKMYCHGPSYVLGAGHPDQDVFQPEEASWSGGGSEVHSIRAIPDALPETDVYKMDW